MGHAQEVVLTGGSVRWDRFRASPPSTMASNPISRARYPPTIPGAAAGTTVGDGHDNPADHRAGQPGPQRQDGVSPLSFGDHRGGGFVPIRPMATPIRPSTAATSDQRRPAVSA